MKPIVLPHQRPGSRVLVYQDGSGDWRVACYVGQFQRPAWDVLAGTREEALLEAQALGAVLPARPRRESSERMGRT